MPLTVKQQIFLMAFQTEYMNERYRSQVENGFGLHTITLIERANMLALMQNWVADHDNGGTEDLFVELYKEFARPLHSRKGKQALEQAASEAQASGGNALQAQLAKAVELRNARMNVFTWDKEIAGGSTKKAVYGPGMAAIKMLDEQLARNRKDLLAGKEVTSVSSRDATTLGVSAVQAVVLDALLHKYKDIRMLFTTAKMVYGSMFLKMLASSMELYQRGFIMNPTVLDANAPKASSISWDIRLNDFFLHAGIMKGAAFVFVTSSVEYATFLDPKTMDAGNRAKMAAAPVGSTIPGLGTFKDMNYPVKPGGSEILTLLEYGYDIDHQDPRFYVDAKLGFVMVPGQGRGARRERFLEIHSKFNESRYRRLVEFTHKLAGLGIYQGTLQPIT